MMYRTSMSPSTTVNDPALIVRTQDIIAVTLSAQTGIQATTPYVSDIRISKALFDELQPDMVKLQSGDNFVYVRSAAVLAYTRVPAPEGQEERRALYMPGFTIHLAQGIFPTDQAPHLTEVVPETFLKVDALWAARPSGDQFLAVMAHEVVVCGIGSAVFDLAGCVSAPIYESKLKKGFVCTGLGTLRPSALSCASRVAKTDIYQCYFSSGVVGHHKMIAIQLTSELRAQIATQLDADQHRT